MEPMGYHPSKFNTFAAVMIGYLVNAGVTTFLEIGPGQALTGMLKRIAKGVITLNVSNRTDIEKVVGTIREMGLVVEV